MIIYFLYRGEQFDSFTGETELKDVTTVYVHEVEEILHLETTEGDIDTTTNHPFYVIDKGWVAAGDLKAGDEVYNLDGTTAVVTNSELEKLDEPILVYNLEVEDFHTYFVGCEPVLVHNSCDNKPAGSSDNAEKRQNGDQQALRELAKEANKDYKRGNPISKHEAELFDEWAAEYNVPQYHQAYDGSGSHWVENMDHTHIYNIHVPYVK